MAIIRCKMCGGDLKVSPELSTVVCEYCGIEQTVPRADDEKKLLQFERAEKLRRSCEFDKAAGIYESIVADFRDEAEAYWGLVLCKYGIEYVDDPATGKKIPTCHRSSFDSVMDDPDLEFALENADIDARKVYRAEAKTIEEIRKGIISVSAAEAPYDIFICYKETDHNGERTVDSVLAQDIYDALTDKGFRVFFARISLEDKLGLEYEPYIFAALNSARIMLAVGTDYEYYNAVWVKNEWSRFLKQMANDKEKHLIPCYKGIDAYDMPKEFGRLQAQDMGKIGAMQDLLRGIEKLMPRKSPQKKAEPALDSASTLSSSPLLKRAFMFLEDSDWKSADEYCEKVLDIDPECARAYLGKLMAELNVSKEENLADQFELFDDNSNYLKAYRFADSELRAALDGYIAAIQSRMDEHRIAREKEEESARLEKERIAEAERLEREKWEAIRRKAREEKAEQERLHKEKLAEQRRINCDKLYDEALALMKKKKYRRAADIFDSIMGHKDSAELLHECRELMAKTKRKKTVAAFVSVAAVVLCIALLAVFVISPYISYANGNYVPFIDTYGIREFNVPKSARVIPKEACKGSKSVETVRIHLAVSSVGESAFESCENLRNLVIPDSVESIGMRAFMFCTGLESIYIADSVVFIGNYAFANCESLKEIELPDKLENVGVYMFESCSSLEDVTVPQSVTTICDHAFANCTSLKSIDISNVKTIASSAFSGCSSLESVTLGSALYSIGGHAFNGCTSLVEIEIPRYVKAISSDAFIDCENLEVIRFRGSESKWAEFNVSLPEGTTVICTDN